MARSATPVWEEQVIEQNSCNWFP